MSIFYLHIKDSKIVMAMVVKVCNSKLLVTKIVVYSTDINSNHNYDNENSNKNV